jgi:predicted DNA-binding ribbon-helix-helix protein
MVKGRSRELIRHGTWSTDFGAGMIGAIVGLGDAMAQSAPRSTDSLIRKRSVVFGPRKTSISLEDEFWQALREIARSRQISTGELVGVIEIERGRANLSSAIRVFVLEYYRSRLLETKLIATN